MINKNNFATFKKSIVLIGVLSVMLIVPACSTDGNPSTEPLPTGQISLPIEDLSTNNTPTPATNSNLTNEEAEQQPTETDAINNSASEHTEPTPTPEPIPSPEPTEQHIEPPVVNESPPASANLHPFANALSEFFVNIAPVPEWALPSPENTHTMPFSTHAILVDVDSNGTQGMLASKWTTDVQRYLPGSSAESILVHRLFLLFPNNLTRPMELHNIAVTPARRLITMGGVDGQGISMSAYTLLEFNNNQLAPIKSIMRTAYGHWEYHGVETWVSAGVEDSYAMNYHTGEFWNRDWEQDQPLTHDEFHQMMTRYGLHGANPFVWELPDETDQILTMS